jgi:hypothetical protein
MASDRQIAANRLNAQKSTGPKTEAGKQHSRRNTLRHGLTAETIFNVLEDPADYEAFETGIRGAYQPRTAVEHELISRLASLLWRLRRSTAIESGLLQIHAKVLRERRAHNRAQPQRGNGALGIFYTLIPTVGASKPESIEATQDQQAANPEPVSNGNPEAAEPVQSDLVRAFMRLVKIDNDVFERLGRYEMSLWRQTAQTIVLLSSLKQRIKRTHGRANYRLERTRPRPPPFLPPHFYR